MSRRMVVITGAPGVGKSSVAKVLEGRVSGTLVLDGDITARKEIQSDYRLVQSWLADWLRSGADIAESGRTLILAVFVRPRELVDLDEYRLLDDVIYIALVTGARELTERLRERPKSAGISDEEIAALSALNDELEEIGAADPRVSVVNTSGRTLAETADFVERLVVEKLGSESG